jgi:5'-nucleotidase
MMRTGFTRGKSGVQTVYDVFAVAPLGAGVLDTTAGSTLVTGYLTGEGRSIPARLSPALPA